MCLEDPFSVMSTPDTIAVVAIFQARNARVAVRQLVSAEAGLLLDDERSLKLSGI